MKEPEPWAPPKWEVADVFAMQALVQGEATPEQQKRALDWIINPACGTYDLDYRSDQRSHAFVSGRRFVGLEIVKLLRINTAKFRQNGE